MNVIRLGILGSDLWIQGSQSAWTRLGLVRGHDLWYRRGTRPRV